MLSDKLKGISIVLASKSPRRQQLLRELGLEFDVRANGDDDEIYPDGLSMIEIPVFLAQQKASSIVNNLKANEILITSDTIVWCDGHVIGKPEDANDAYRILRLLSGNKHTVVTGVCLSSTKSSSSFYATTDVFFRVLTDEEIWHYINNYRPFDKAGAYGVQEWIGYIGVEHIEGSYYNVMGLPVQKLYIELQKFVDQFF